MESKMVKDLAIGDVYTLRSPDYCVDCNATITGDWSRTFTVASLPTTVGMIPGIVSHQVYTVGEGNETSSTEDLVTDSVWVLNSADKVALMGVCGHPKQFLWHGHIPGRVMGGTWINGTDFTECRVCTKRMY